MTMRAARTLPLCFVLLAGCGRQDNSAETDRASEELRKAQAALGEHSKNLVDNQNAIEQTKRDLAREQAELARQQQELADQQRLLEQQRQKLGSAEEALKKARVAYAAAIQERLAKLDASLASLATRTDARSKDALVGLRARRDQLAAKLATLSGTASAGWSDYTNDVDTTFDAMEQDLREVLK
jgi:chromosome segregation ATPase